MNNDQLSRKRPVEESSIPNKERAIARDYILNADGTVLLDHKGVSKKAHVVLHSFTEALVPFLA